MVRVYLYANYLLVILLFSSCGEIKMFLTKDSSKGGKVADSSSITQTPEPEKPAPPKSTPAIPLEGVPNKSSRLSPSAFSQRMYEIFRYHVIAKDWKLGELDSFSFAPSVTQLPEGCSNGFDPKVGYSRKTDLRFYQYLMMRSAIYVSLNKKSEDQVQDPFGIEGPLDIPSSQQVLSKLRCMLLAINQVPRWVNPLGEVKNNDLYRAQLLIGMVYAYRLLGDRLSAEEKRLIQNKVEKEGLEIYQYLMEPRNGHFRAYHENHHWWNGSAIYLASQMPAQTFKESQAHSQWALFVKDNFRKAFFAVHTPEGSSYEGSMYFDYGRAAMLPFLRALPEEEKAEFYGPNSWIRNSSYFMADNILPDGYRTTCFSHNGIRCGHYDLSTVFDFELARNIRDRNLQRYAVERYESYVKGALFRGLATGEELFTYDPTLEVSETPAPFPSSKYYSDLGVVIASNGRLGPPLPGTSPADSRKRSYLYFKSGIQGGAALRNYMNAHPGEIPETTGGHLQGDSNSFMYYLDGDILFRNFGMLMAYRIAENKSHYPYRLLNHSLFSNTMTFTAPGLSTGDQLGQYWSTTDPLDGSLQIRDYPVLPTHAPDAKMEKYWTSKEGYFTYARGEAAEAYRYASGGEGISLERFKRNFIYTPEYLLMYDSVRWTATARRPQWNFHLQGLVAGGKDAKGNYEYTVTRQYFEGSVRKSSKAYLSFRSLEGMEGWDFKVISGIYKCDDFADIPVSAQRIETLICQSAYTSDPNFPTYTRYSYLQIVAPVGTSEADLVMLVSNKSKVLSSLVKDSVSLQTEKSHVISLNKSLGIINIDKLPDLR